MDVSWTFIAIPSEVTVEKAKFRTNIRYKFGIFRKNHAREDE
jgi:hypothetical protein